MRGWPTAPPGPRRQRHDQEHEDGDGLRAQVVEHYGALAREVLTSADQVGCCSPAACAPEGNPITTGLYTEDESTEVPAAALAASLGCGNPTALAELHDGEVVLDLGSGGGIDVLLSARRVGPTGFAYGLDASEDMLELARRNQQDAGVTNVEFLQGSLEDIPLPDRSVDVVISNCVVNLSTDKPRALREAFRVLKPGGRFAVSDIVVRGELDPQVRRSVEAWAGCVAGAFEEDEYRRGLADAGFIDIEIQPTRVYTVDDARQLLEWAGIDPEAARPAEGRVVSAFVRAVRRD